MAETASATAPTTVVYPERDGKPLAESDVHRRELTGAIETLSDWFRQRPDVYVAGNLFLFYEEGNPQASVAPDVFVVRGVCKGERSSYKLWEEGKAPALAIEISSRSTRWEDLGTKRGIYAALGVSEYFLFDPLAEHLKPHLQGFLLRAGEYFRIVPRRDGAHHSKVLRLDLVADGSRLRFVDPRTGQRLPTPAEAMEQARVERAARQFAEERLRKVEAELRKLRAARRRAP